MLVIRDIAAAVPRRAGGMMDGTGLPPFLSSKLLCLQLPPNFYTSNRFPSYLAHKMNLVPGIGCEAIALQKEGEDVSPREAVFIQVLLLYCRASCFHLEVREGNIKPVEQTPRCGSFSLLDAIETRKSPTHTGLRVGLSHRLWGGASVLRGCRVFS